MQGNHSEKAIASQSARVGAITAAYLHSQLTTEEIRALPPGVLKSYSSENFVARRGYAEVEVHGHSFLAFLDEGSDVSMISRNLLEHACPNWREETPHAGDVELHAINNTNIPLEDARVLSLRISHPDALTMVHKFIITPDEDKLLIGRDAKDNLLMGADWDLSADKRVFYGTTRHTQRNKKVRFPIYRKQPSVGKNKNAAYIPVGKKQKFHFNVKLSQAEASVAKISTIGKIHKEDLAIGKMRPCKKCADCTMAEMVNLGDTRIFADVGSLAIEVSPLDKSRVAKAAQASAVIMDRLIVATARAAHSKGDRPKDQEAKVEAATPAHDKLVERLKAEAQVFDPDDSEELRETYKVPEDVLPSEEALAERIGFDAEDERRDIEDLIRMDRIDPKYQGRVRKLLIDKYPKLVARHSFDCGNISRTLGYMYVPLAKPLPRTRKVYYPNSKQLQ